MTFPPARSQGSLWLPPRIQLGAEEIVGASPELSPVPVITSCRVWRPEQSYGEPQGMPLHRAKANSPRWCLQSKAFCVCLRWGAGSVKEVFCFVALLLGGNKAGEKQDKVLHTKAEFTRKSWGFQRVRNIYMANAACLQLNSSSAPLLLALAATDLGVTLLVLSPKSWMKCFESCCLLHHNCFCLLSAFM